MRSQQFGRFMKNAGTLRLRPSAVPQAPNGGTEAPNVNQFLGMSVKYSTSRKANSETYLYSESPALGSIEVKWVSMKQIT